MDRGTPTFVKYKEGTAMVQAVEEMLLQRDAMLDDIQLELM